MATLEIVQQASKEQRSDGFRHGHAVKPASVEQAKDSAVQARTTLIQTPDFTRVYLSNRVGFSVHGLLRSVSRGGIELSTPIPVSIHSPLQVVLEGCRPFGGEALYCTKRGSGYRVGIVFSTHHKPNLETGAVAYIRSLEPPFTTGRGSILEMVGSSASIFGKVEFDPEVRVRIDCGRWTLFGRVKNLLSTTGISGHYLDVHMEAAFPANTADPVTSKAVSIRFHSKPDTPTSPSRVPLGEGAES